MKSSSVLFWITALVVAITALFFSFRFPLLNRNFAIFPLSSQQQRLFTAEELALYNGTDYTLPILLAILGSVFDVTGGKSHYGVGGGYHHFAGRDASRAFFSGNFTGDGLTDSLRGLSSAEVKSIVEWRDFYFRSYKYLPVSNWGNFLNVNLKLMFLCLPFRGSVGWDRNLFSASLTYYGFQNSSLVLIMLFVGKLVGRYYDSQGNPTKSLKGVEAKAARGAQLSEKQKNEEAKLPSCNSRWSQGEGGEVWCEDGFPRLVQRPLEIALTGKMSKRCACFKEDQLNQPGLEVYEGCDYLGKTCRV